MSSVTPGTRSSARSRSKTAKALASEEQNVSVVTVSDGESSPPGRKQRRKSLIMTIRRSGTPSSRLSTPTSSRANSPMSRSSKKSKTKMSKKSSGNSTPVTSKKNIKLKTKIGRGYNPSLVNYKESEYHYGSDFEDEEYEVNDRESEKSETESSQSEEESDDSDELKVESDVDVDNVDLSKIDNSPLPFWLRSDDDDSSVPSLVLPESSEDLLIDSSHLLKVVSIYEILRHCRLLLRLTPFRLEDFCLALKSEDQSTLLSEVHVALLRFLIRGEEKDGTQFGPLDVKDSTNCFLYFVDSVTWPECLRAYLYSDQLSFGSAYDYLKDNEYPFGGDFLNKRIVILSLLTDQFLSTTMMRDYILNEGTPSMEDHCRACHRLGDMLVCECCSGVYHLSCLDPPLEEIPDEDWSCYVCEANKTRGVTDSGNQGFILRHESLGTDRNGSKYWFISRRIFVETLSTEEGGTGEILYYSSVGQFNELVRILDPEIYEIDLLMKIEQERAEIVAQMKITLDITISMNTSSRMSYLEMENDSIDKLVERRKKEEEEKMLELLNTEISDEKKTETANGPLTRRTKQAMTDGTLYFKLGQEASFKSYINQYTTNAVALSKVQANEERDRKRYMSHKFSLTDVSTFKWQGSVYGGRIALANTVRCTLVSLEANIPDIFMHSNWSLLKKPWQGAVSSCTTARDFARALTVLVCCMRPCVSLNVWTDQLGHTSFKKMTSTMRDEKKKMEKREKKEQDEKDKLKPFMTFVKYTLGLKHTVSKQKGEEYRAHGQNGWLWISESRYFKPTDARTVGLRAGPHRMAVKYTDIRNNTDKIVLMEPRAFEYLLKRQKDLEESKSNGESESNPDDKLAVDKKKLEDALKNARLNRQVPSEDLLSDVVDVESGLSNPTRVLYPKVAKKARVLDDFLTRRIQLKTYEEQTFSSKITDSDDEESKSFIEGAKKNIWVFINKLKESTDSIYSCYSANCGKGKYLCYSSNCPKKSKDLSSAIDFYKTLLEQCDSKFKVKLTPFTNGDSDRIKLQELFMSSLKSLMNIKKSDEKTPVLSNGIKEGEEEEQQQQERRVYSSTDTSSKLYLKKLKKVGTEKKTGKIVKYPLAPRFFAKSRKSKSILLLAKHDVKHLARKWGSVNCEGFNYSAKTNMSVWPYPCPRPIFKTTWFYRTAGATSIQAIALQLRILWASIRWDDIHTKIPADLRHQVTTDTHIFKREILKHRCSGRFSEKTEFLQKKIAIPLDVPKTLVEVAPIRSGLRKRKRAESPQASEPQISEEWIDESKFELWEIRAYREKIERVLAQTRTRTGTIIREPVKYEPPPIPEKKERILHPQPIKKDLPRTPVYKPSITTTTPVLKTQMTPKPINDTSPAFIRRIKNPDGSVSLVKTIAKPPNIIKNQTSTPTKKLYVSKDGKIIGSQMPSLSPGTPNSNQHIKKIVSSPGQQQKVQIIRGSDGKLQVRGLLPGQQLVQMPDGKLQIYSQPSTGVKATPPPTPPTPKPSPNPSVKQIVATPLAPGSSIPPGMTVFMSNGKTFAIPKASTIAAQQQMIPSSPQKPQIQIPPKPVTSPAVQSPSKPTQMVSVQSLGQNTVSIRGNQMIVSGPDQAQAEVIAKQLSSGQARLGTIGGKQVLISTAPSTGATKTTTIEQNLSQPITKPEPEHHPLENSVNLPSEPLPSVPPAQIEEEVHEETIPLTQPEEPPVFEEEKKQDPLVTAQIVKTPQGPRIILQGIQGANLPKEQLMDIQQRVKSQLLKAQAEAKLRSEVPPTKIAVELPLEIQELILKQQAEKLEASGGKSILSGGNEQLPVNPPKTVLVQQQQKTIVAGSSTSEWNTTPTKTSPQPAPKSQQPKSSSEEKKTRAISNKLSADLFKQKEKLKKDIAKKRALQEKQLQFVIQKEVESLLQSVRKSEESSSKRRLSESEDSPGQTKKKRRRSSGQPAAAIQAGLIKKDKVYCICKTKYDATKFYVGCDTCNNWFHGSCVGITEDMSKTMTEYFCDECKSAKDNQEIYCLCRQPYDELQFYIGCEKCSDWFHGRCVGILQVEADNIDEYICPKCDSKTSYNYANLKSLGPSDYDLIRKLYKQLATNRNSGPFKHPVDPNDVPNYYTVVKEPMDLQTIELRINQKHYQRLCDFVGDVMRIFENCRYFNQPNSQVLKSAENLENYFAQKLAFIREKVATS